MPRSTRPFRFMFFLPRSMNDSVRADARIFRTNCFRRCDMSSEGMWRKSREPREDWPRIRLIPPISIHEPAQSGDLAFKKVFPASQSLVKRGRLSIPVGPNRDGICKNQATSELIPSKPIELRIILIKPRTLRRCLCGSADCSCFRETGTEGSNPFRRWGDQ